MVLRISNRDARHLWLHQQGLSATPTGVVSTDVLAKIIRQLGFVQLDTIRIVARAHHHILWSRNQHYRETMFDDLLERQRAVFEHFTHDASILPMDFYPYWQRQFNRCGERLKKGNWGKFMASAKERQRIRKRIEKEGPLCSRDFKGKADKSVHAWMRPPHKLALDYMWYTGDLTTSHRRNFIKHYDLSSRVIPLQFYEDQQSDPVQIDWLCRGAIERLGFANDGEIQRFWDACSLPEVKKWVAENQNAYQQVEVETHDHHVLSAYAPVDIEDRLKVMRMPTSRLRIINPFDPIVRDRDRLERIFGFSYRIEIFVPAKKRQYGYYVYPILEGDRFIGRIEVRGDRKKGILTAEKLWLEPRVQLSESRKRKLQGELARMAKFIGVETINSQIVS